MSKKRNKHYLNNQQPNRESKLESITQNQNNQDFNKDFTIFGKLSTVFDKPKNQNQFFWGALLLVIFVSFFTHFRGYQKPAHFFWDENYHTPSAYKYLHKTFYMEPHPPLGKLFIAAGEYLYNYTHLLDGLGPIGFTKRGDYVYSALDDVVDKKLTEEKRDLLKNKNFNLWEIKNTLEQNAFTETREKCGIRHKFYKSFND
jgi:hypothetical protein